MGRMRRLSPGGQQHRDSTEVLVFIACFCLRSSVGSACPLAPSADRTSCLPASSWPCPRINLGIQTQTAARLPPPKPTKCWLFFLLQMSPSKFKLQTSYYLVIFRAAITQCSLQPRLLPHHYSVYSTPHLPFSRETTGRTREAAGLALKRGRPKSSRSTFPGGLTYPARAETPRRGWPRRC